MYKVSIKTVQDWRLRGCGPVGVKFGRHVRYNVTDIEAWEQQRRQQAAS